MDMGQTLFYLDPLFSKRLQSFDLALTTPRHRTLRMVLKT